MTEEEIMELVIRSRTDENFGLDPEEIELRDSEERESIRIGEAMIKNKKIYELGIIRNKRMLERWKDTAYSWAFERWEAIIADGGYERVIAMHLKPRPHQQLLSSSPFITYGAREETIK